MTVDDNTVQAKGLGSFSKNLGKISAKAFTKLATNVSKIPGRALEVTSNIAAEAASRTPKADLSLLPEVIKIYHEGRGFYLGNFT